VFFAQAGEAGPPTSLQSGELSGLGGLPIDLLVNLPQEMALRQAMSSLHLSKTHLTLLFAQ